MSVTDRFATVRPLVLRTLIPATMPRVTIPQTSGRPHSVWTL
jgi:hypothetical protein